MLVCLLPSTKYILGGQANLWTEYIATPEYAEYMLFPRMFALTEAVWSPKEYRDWRSFIHRLPRQLRRLDALGINYRHPKELGL